MLYFEVPVPNRGRYLIRDTQFYPICKIHYFFGKLLNHVEEREIVINSRREGKPNGKQCEN